jgi:hypothetical protein
MEGRRGAWPHLAIVAVVHLAVAWPGVVRRGVIAEEIQPYLRAYPRVLDVDRDRVFVLNDDPHPHFVGTPQWPEVAYQGRTRVWPLFVRGHQTAIGTYWGIALSPALGGGVAGVRRSSVLLELALLFLLWGLARRLGLSRTWSTIAALGCALSPGLWFFARTGYGFELASRVAMLATLFVAARPLGERRAVAVGALFALAVLCRATIVVTMAPAVLALVMGKRRTVPAVAAIVIGCTLPILLVGVAMRVLPFAEAPGKNLALSASRALVAPQMAAMQLAWVIDPRVVLGPLFGGALSAGAGWVRPLLGGIVAAIAISRWSGNRETAGERMFVCAFLANAVAGALLYAHPRQFQLGMALEPLFVLALVSQLAELRVGTIVAAILLGARVATLSSLMIAERTTDNPMLSGRAQGALADWITAHGLRDDDLVTTSYDHVGLLESRGVLRPLHAWRLFRGAPPEKLVVAWKQILAAHPARYVLLTRGHNLEAGPFADDAAVAAALEKAAPIRERTVITGDGGGPVFELVSLAGF